MSEHEEKIKKKKKVMIDTEGTMMSIPVHLSLTGDDAPGHNEHSYDLQGPLCWKCNGCGEVKKKKKKCTVCEGVGRLKPKRKIIESRTKPGRITKCRGGPKPGPKPRGNPKNIKELNPQMGEELCCLVGSWRIFQCIGGHRYSTEDVVTSYLAGRSIRNASKQDPTFRVTNYLDLGTGIGSVLQMVTWQLLQTKYSRDVVSCVGVEAQKKSAAMARRSILYNGVEGQCRVVHGDIRSFDENFCNKETKKYALITGTPPYFKIEFDPKTKTSRCVQGSLPSAAQSAPARCEFRGGVEVYCAAASKHLCSKNKHARFIVCEGGLMFNRERAQKGANEFGLEILSRVDVIPKMGKKILFSVYEMALKSNKDAKPTMINATDTKTRRDGDIYVQTITVRDGSGDRTKEYTSLLSEMGMN